MDYICDPQHARIFDAKIVHHKVCARLIPTPFVERAVEVIAFVFVWSTRSPQEKLSRFEDLLNVGSSIETNPDLCRTVNDIRIIRKLKRMLSVKDSKRKSNEFVWMRAPMWRDKLDDDFADGFPEKFLNCINSLSFRWFLVD